MTGRTPLSRDLIGQTALELAESNGLDSLSMRRLAEALGCEAMSLYHHVEGIDGVKDAIMDTLFGIISTRLEGKTGDYLESYGVSLIEIACDYPEAFKLLATRLWSSSDAEAFAASAFERMGECGLRGDQLLTSARILTAYVNGAGLALGAWRGIAQGDQSSMESVKADLLRGYAALVQQVKKRKI
ncbi:MAG: hypothetical protein CMK09_01580 [Ponticaulis sp.]|nr:hypothetical protein [Ponticaulis sp.]|tara:strand:- start:6099 stop:6656 length:558 start_codon:yes stop_codon:yes gene_type:complete